MFTRTDIIRVVFAEITGQSCVSQAVWEKFLLRQLQLPEDVFISNFERETGLKLIRLRKNLYTL